MRKDQEFNSLRNKVELLEAELEATEKREKEAVTKYGPPAVY
jgi:hypothetical protein